MDENEEKKEGVTPPEAKPEETAKAEAKPAETPEAPAPAAAQESTGKPLFPNQPMEFLNEMSVGLTIEVGRTEIKIRELLNLSKDSIIELNKGAGEPVDIYANGKLISRGNIITANGKYCVRLTAVTQTESEKT